MRKKDESTDAGSEWSAPAGGRVTPQDVQQKEFRVTRVGAGYRMREVDEFLDQITDTLSALIAENERLRVAGGSPPAPSASQGPPVAAPSRADRGAVDAFLQQEKGFLQDLGGLVQAHAEELRSMIRAVRAEGASTAAAPVVVEEAEPVASSERATEQAAEQTVEPVAVQSVEQATEPVADQTAEPAPEPAASTDEPLPGSDEIEPPTEPAGEAEAEADDGDTGTITRVVAEEPIRLEEPQPARSARSEEKDGDSLRELFWGEE
jgi:DivIVA domain-containing protein